MNSKNDSPPSDPAREAETAVAIALHMHQLADEATRVAIAACERANDLPLLAKLTKR